MSIQSDGRYVNDASFDLNQGSGQVTENPEFDAPDWVLIWRRFKRHRLALISGLFLAFSYLMLPFAGFIAPYTANERQASHLYAPPQGISFFHDGKFIGPHVYKTTAKADLENFRWNYETNESEPVALEFFCKGSSYRFLGLLKMDRHLFCAPGEATIFLLGSDRLGRDVFSRILYGAQLSLTVGLIGIAVSFTLGILFGSIAGYFGGKTDWTIQRVIEILRSLPELPLWLALSAAVPSHWGPVVVFFVISIILGILDWPGLARAVRAKFLSLREEQFVQAAEMMGAKPSRVILPIILVVLAFNFLGDGLRDSLDPYSH